MKEYLTPVDTVTSWNDPDERGDLVVRYDELRCPECGRMWFCIYWLKVGYPEVHCPHCGIREHWPFEDYPELKRAYEGRPLEVTSEIETSLDEADP